MDMDGLWAMIFTTEDGGRIAAGVIQITGVAAAGGDNGFYWYGVIGRGPGGVSGTLNVHRYIKEASPLFPGVNPDFYVVNVKGGDDPTRLWASVEAENAPYFKCVLEMRKVHALPR